MANKITVSNHIVWVQDWGIDTVEDSSSNREIQLHSNGNRNKREIVRMRIWITKY